MGVDDQPLLALLAAGPKPLSQLCQMLGLPAEQVNAQLQQLALAGVALEHDSAQWQLVQALDLHDAAHLRQHLPASLLGQLGALDVCWEVDSTNSELLRRPVPEAGVTVLLAERQLAGRGRRGRQWVSPLAQHLYLSLACRFAGGIAAMSGLSLAVGVLVVEALRAQGLTRVGLKWPNDIVLDEQKLGGILVESRGSSTGPALAVIGIGLNVHQGLAVAPAIDQPWTSIARQMPQLACRDTLAAALLEHLLPGLQHFQQQGLPAFIERFAALDVLAGQPVWIHEHGQRTAAMAQGLAADGALQVVDDQGVRCVHAGDVSVRKQ